MSVVNVVAGQVTNQFLYRQNMSRTLYGRVNIFNGLPNLQLRLMLLLDMLVHHNLLFMEVPCQAAMSWQLRIDFS